jgi:hypothetical protein
MFTNTKKGKVHSKKGTKVQRGKPWRYMWVGGQRHAPAALTLEERRPTQCTGSWTGPTAGLDMCGKSHRHWDSIPGPSSPQRVFIPTELFRPTAFTNIHGDVSRKMSFQHQTCSIIFSPDSPCECEPRYWKL